MNLFKGFFHIKFMRKTIIFSVLILLAISMLGVVSAKTLISGKIYNAGFTKTIPNANVTVDCNGNVQDTLSLGDGSYAVTFSGTGNSSCDNSDSLTVSAIKGGLYGSKTGIIHNNAFADWNLAIVNVPLVPEFGLFVGILTILGSLSVFFIIRRN